VGFLLSSPLERRSRKDKSGDSAIKLALIAPINSNRKLSRACGPGESSTVQTETTPHWRQEYNTLTFPRLLGGRNCPRSLLSPEKSARGRVRWCASAFFMCRFCCTGVHMHARGNYRARDPMAAKKFLYHLGNCSTCSIVRRFGTYGRMVARGSFWLVSQISASEHHKSQPSLYTV